MLHRCNQTSVGSSQGAESGRPFAPTQEEKLQKKKEGGQQVGIIGPQHD
jgi:hypothetical protein